VIGFSPESIGFEYTVLEYCRSGFYNWRQRKLTVTSEEKKRVQSKSIELHGRRKNTYGVDRIPKGPYNKREFFFKKDCCIASGSHHMEESLFREALEEVLTSRELQVFEMKRQAKEYILSILKRGIIQNELILRLATSAQLSVKNVITERGLRSFQVSRFSGILPNGCNKLFKGVL